MNIFIYSISDVKMLDITPYPGIGVEAVVENHTLIWSLSDDVISPSVHVVVHLKAGEFRLLALDINRNNQRESIYYHKFEGSWLELERESYIAGTYAILQEIVIDICNVSEELFKIVNFTSFGNSSIKLSGLDKYSSITVRENGWKLLHKGLLDNEMINTLTIFNRRQYPILFSIEFLTNLNDNPTFVHYHYGKCQGGDWIRLSNNDFQLITDDMCNERTLNINGPSPDQSAFNIIRHHPYGMPSIIYTGLDKNYASEVKDNNIIIWSTEIHTKLKCIDVQAFYDTNNQPFLCQLFIASPNDTTYIFFEKNDQGRWIQLQDEEYYNKVRHLDQNNQNQ